MKKYILISVPVILVLASLGIVMFSDSAIPGDAMYGIDREMESLELSISKSLNNVTYARVNLDLAGERLSEIKALKLIGRTKNAYIFKANAQTNLNENTDTLISQLIADFKKNIIEVSNILGDSSTVSLQLSKEIAQKTTEFSNEILTILPDLESNDLSDMEDVASSIESLDESAVDDIVTKTESETPDQESQSIASEKISKLVLKVTERVVELTKKLNEKKNKLSAENISAITSGISQINGDLEQAKNLLVQGQLQEAYDLLKETKVSVAQLMDLTDQEIEDVNSKDSKKDSTEESKDSSENELENEVENEVENEENSDDGQNEVKQQTKTETKKTESRGSDNNEDGEDSDTEVESENKQEDPEDAEVEGVTNQIDNEIWLKFIF